MTERDKKEGNERRYPLTPQAEANLNEVLTNLVEDMRHTCVQKYDNIQEYFNGEI